MFVSRVRATPVWGSGGGRLAGWLSKMGKLFTFEPSVSYSTNGLLILEAPLSVRLLESRYRVVEYFSRLLYMYGPHPLLIPIQYIARSEARTPSFPMIIDGNLPPTPSPPAPPPLYLPTYMYLAVFPSK